MAGIVFIFVLGYLYPVIGTLGKPLLLGSGMLLLIDLLLLFRPDSPIHAQRKTPERLSNGDPNLITILVQNFYPFKSTLQIIDEQPYQFQIRDSGTDLTLNSESQEKITYTLHPTERGDYTFGALNVYAGSPIGLVQRRFQFEEQQTIPVYPSFIQMHKFELFAISDRLTEVGIKKIRRIGHTLEFDQIREYVRGDDIRSINWKATARHNDLMVNQFQDERSQQVYSAIDMGRTMKMPFDELSLLDYAINTSLVISNIAIRKHDKAGLITFSNKEGPKVPAQTKKTHIYRIQETLYNLETDFKETDFSRLYLSLKHHVRQRSLILLYTNFESLSAMHRHLPYLKKIASEHLLVTIFFQNTELERVLTSQAKTEEEIYRKVIAEKFFFEKRSIVQELSQLGIQTILTPPNELSISTINKYLELKARGLI
ncbi:DUF58 domain-containing protein [Aliifodinibius sp. S!AR15-10]|uniref:DUF58 domain-containing protein n=1 Tax=Aliifodinibius sp. S!AR15-10 TaxID=2950437 RepID=UPI00285C714E|nr:DUF58 domain-containing protein [Aliifodinibius sp. S!AR15-10]MDR8393199.1 DUF58 domain-containing protein [Aliifodinibius sp. S!AR15-10]